MFSAVKALSWKAEVGRGGGLLSTLSVAQSPRPLQPAVYIVLSGDTLVPSSLVPSRGAAGRLSGQERSVTFRGSGQTCPISPPVPHSQLYSVRGATDWGVR